MKINKIKNASTNIFVSFELDAVIGSRTAAIMKRIFAFALATVLVMFLFINIVTASMYDGIYGTSVADTPQIDNWKTEGYPEYISFVYESGGWVEENDEIYTTYAIGTVNATLAEKEYIVSLFPRTYVIKFYDCSVNHTERERIVSEIIAQKDINIISVCLMQSTEQIYIIIRQDLFLSHYLKSLPEKYGDIFYITDEPAEPDVQTIGNTGVSTINYWVFSLLLILFFTLFVYIYRKKRTIAINMNTTNGDTVEKSVYVSRKDVIGLIKKGRIKTDYKKLDSIIREAKNKK